MKALLLFVLMVSGCQVLAADEPAESPAMTPQELPGYQFDQKQAQAPAVVSDLSVGQSYYMDRQREEAKNLLSQKLGILHFNAELADMTSLQQLYDRKVLGKDDARDWQNVGVLFGDILAKQFSLHWVSYKDDLGISKCLQWRDTQNFVFPVTMFSKRMQFDEQIDVRAIYDDIKSTVEAFKAREARLGKAEE
ncbi:MAG: DUF3806 domain-containing protein [Pseudomonadales bacterium]|nr:DUF3806 domain-containing protein [Pseudomonadales bacterium]